MKFQIDSRLHCGSDDSDLVQALADSALSSTHHASVEATQQYHQGMAQKVTMRRRTVAVTRSKLQTRSMEMMMMTMLLASGRPDLRHRLVGVDLFALLDFENLRVSY